VDVLLPWLIAAVSATTLVTLGGASIAAIAYVARWEERSTRDRTLAWLSHHWGLTTRDDHLAGHLEKHPATIAMRTLKGRDGLERLFVLEVHGLPRDVALRGDGRHLEGQPRTGDAYLDRKWAIAALDGAVGRLHHTARHELERIRRLADYVAIEGGVLQVRCARADRLTQVREAVHLVVRSLGTGALATELEQRVTDDPLPTVRATMLWHLAQLDRARATRLAARMAAHAPEEKLITGILLDERPRLVEAIEHPDGRLRIARRAGRHFLKTGGAAEVLFQLLRRRYGLQGLLAAMDLGRGVEGVEREVHRYLPSVVQQMRTKPRLARPVLVAFARRLAAQQGTQAEDQLMTLLAIDDEGVRLAALVALGICGTVRVVGPVQELHDHAGPFSAVRRRAQRTLDTIKSRAPGAIGGLMLADAPAEQGRVSEASPPRRAGAVALADRS